MLKKALKIAGIALAVIVVLLAGLKLAVDARYFSAYDPKAPFNVQVRAVTEMNPEDPARSYQLVDFTFAGVNGGTVPTLMTFPSNAAKKVPMVIFLHGIGQKKDFLKEITVPFNKCGFAMACFDQQMQGERKLPKDAGWWAQFQAFRTRPAKTINETRRLVDYLQTHPQIDPQRIYLCGASYGAITGSTVLSFDKRIRAGVLVYGGGNIRTMLEAPMIKDELGTVGLALIKPVAAYVLGAADPVKYAGGIAPTPVFFQNGSRDRLVSPEAGKLLIGAARDPKKVVWYESDHIGMDLENTKQVLKDALGWLLEQDDPFRAPEEKVKQIPDFVIEDT